MVKERYWSMQVCSVREVLLGAEAPEVVGVGELLWDGVFVPLCEAELLSELEELESPESLVDELRLVRSATQTPTIRPTRRRIPRMMRSYLISTAQFYIHYNTRIAEG